MAEWNDISQIRLSRKPPLKSNPDNDINILLLGETGVGKTTFINAFANYLAYDTLEAALKGEMQVLIPSSFSVSDPDTYKSTTITVGTRDKNELCEDNGQSQTQGCKSYLFPIGNRYLRLIDTPGIGDCRGVEKDTENFEHMLAFINRYKNLKGICIILKPNDHRLTISFRYIIKELLKRLNNNAKDNIMFIFTNSRVNFFQPGATANQLKILLEQIGVNNENRVPFEKGNTFCLDNEAFRFLAVHKAGHNFYVNEKEHFVRSWKTSVEEIRRLVARIVRCNAHEINDFRTLNEAQQLIRKLPRPIGEVARLLQENIQLAEQHKKRVLANETGITPHRIPEKTAEITSLRYPRTICTSEECSKITNIDGDMKIDYKIQCHEHCYLKGIEQEVINNPILKHCQAMDKTTGQCNRCSCDWSKHMHVTYEFKKSLGYFDISERASFRHSSRIISRIDERINELKQEQDMIRQICSKLTLFIRKNSINPTNEDVIEYISHFIREEKQKLNVGDDNQQVILGLENLVKEYESEIKLLKSNIDNQTDASEIPDMNDIFACKFQLYELPITGKYLKKQIESLELNQINMLEQREEFIELPRNAKPSSTMRQLEEAVKFRRKPPFNPNPDNDINILLLGETGVGKTTFINAFANYLAYDTLDAALQGEIQVLIPSSFSVADTDTHRLTPITVGTPDKNELCEDNGKSQTQGCKSYLFSIGNRYLRLIDTPGIGDCRGADKDDENFQHILAFLSRYENLKGICILLKPNDHRLNISFRYIIKELLKHLHSSAKDNLMFIFTNARTSFYMPGATANQLRILIDRIDHNKESHIPFAKGNTFLFDNEAFRFLAVHKAGHNFYMDHKQNFIDSWNRSVTELNRLVARIIQCDLHAISAFQSLNEAQQLIRKLPRPIGEVARLLQENIQLAEQHKKRVLANETSITPHRIPEKTAEITSLRYPRTICTSEKCSKLTKIDGEMKIDYKIQCHERCYLRGVEQEVISSPLLKYCRAINKTTGKCNQCGCDWSSHMHVTYEFKRSLSYFDISERASFRHSSRIISRIDERIAALKQEQDLIRHICAKLTLFIRKHSINPTNEDVVEYINYFIQEEKQKLRAGDDNQQIISGLENLIIEYENEMKLLNVNIDNQTDTNEIPDINDIFACRFQLYELPITGKYLEKQIESLSLNQVNLIEEREEYIELPRNSKPSSTMRQLEQAVI